MSAGKPVIGPGTSDRLPELNAIERAEYLAQHGSAGNGWTARYIHRVSPRETDRFRDGQRFQLPEGAFKTRLTLARALRELGVLQAGERLRSFRCESSKVVAFPDRGIWHSVTLEYCV